ncbi:hypothetical protein [Streptomyces justiciae]|uniref:hypothetical protein n=1 Tax=Streptomyces justiciae TaxID=2780140 RepID=UPI0021172D07|nr:hypothetical protein [Streptomyces justiciae]MCW8378288.1 hypothetical protein [Streptomyces justiciae]
MTVRGRVRNHDRVDDTEHLVEVWQRILEPAGVSWVLFENGTCVMLKEPDGELAGQAVEILRQYGPVRAGGPAGDFGTQRLKDGTGWLVTGHHPDVVTYVGSAEPADASDLAVGLHGRSKRHRDGTDLQVVHVEDAR